jgi:phosphate transport system substrate-binding protein
MSAFGAAAANGNWASAKNFAIDLIDQPGELSWPIISATFIELPKNPKDPARSMNVMKFFDWAFSNGDTAATGLAYLPLPENVKHAVRDAWHAQILSPDGKAIF